MHLFLLNSVFCSALIPVHVTQKAVEQDEGKSSGAKSVSFATLLSKPAVWAVLVANIVNHWGYFICLGWMPTYFNKVVFPSA